MHRPTGSPRLEKNSYQWGGKGRGYIIFITIGIIKESGVLNYIRK
jgi:hypothetical protein